MIQAGHFLITAAQHSFQLHLVLLLLPVLHDHAATLRSLANCNMMAGHMKLLQYTSNGQRHMPSYMYFTCSHAMTELDATAMHVLYVKGDFQRGNELPVRTHDFLKQRQAYMQNSPGTYTEAAALVVINVQLANQHTALSA